MLVAIEKVPIVLNGFCEIRKVACSESYSCKYKADQTLFFFERIALREEREEAEYLLAYSYLYQSDLSSRGQVLCLTIVIATFCMLI